MSYGDIAAAIGSRAPRAVGQVMAYYGSDVPWWRVIRSDGHPPLCHDARPRSSYEREGTPLLWSRSGTFRINLRAGPSPPLTTARHRRSSRPPFPPFPAPSNPVSRKTCPYPAPVRQVRVLETEIP